MRRYKIVRNYFAGRHKCRTIKRGLTLKQAKLHCLDPENCSLTCHSVQGKKRTHHLGPWQDSYERDS